MRCCVCTQEATRFLELHPLCEQHFWYVWTNILSFGNRRQPRPHVDAFYPREDMSPGQENALRAWEDSE
jgi:hypothetical protein